jgi:flagellar basal body-associated protein FliL
MKQEMKMKKGTKKVKKNHKINLLYIILVIALLILNCYFVTYFDDLVQKKSE